MFENDRMMRELHEFRRQDYKATKSLSFEEIERIRNERIRNRLKGTDYNLAELEDGTSMIVKKVERQRSRLIVSRETGQ